MQTAIPQRPRMGLWEMDGLKDCVVSGSGCCFFIQRGNPRWMAQSEGRLQGKYPNGSGVGQILDQHIVPGKNLKESFYLLEFLWSKTVFFFIVSSGRGRLYHRPVLTASLDSRGIRACTRTLISLACMHPNTLYPLIYGFLLKADMNDRMHGMFLSVSRTKVLMTVTGI